MTDDQKRTWLKPEQVAKIRDACYSGRMQNQARNDAMIALLYDAGLRPTELINSTTEMFDASDSVLRLPSTVQKQYPQGDTPDPATIELARTEYTSDTVRTVQSYLAGREEDSRYIMAGIKPRTVRHTVKKIAEKAGVEPYAGFAGRGNAEDVTPYSFRHSVAYRMLDAADQKYTLYDVRNRLRHQSLTTTEQHYDFFDRV